MGGYDEESLEESIGTNSMASSGSELSDGAPQTKSKTGVSSDERKLRPIAGMTPMEGFAGGIAGVSVTSAVVAMILQPVNIVFAAGGLTWYVILYIFALLRNHLIARAGSISSSHNILQLIYANISLCPLI